MTVNQLLIDTSMVSRLLDKVLVSEECWEWQACKFQKGYGQFSLHGSSVMAHRVSYIIFVGPIPEGYEIDHLCKNRACIRPSHLEAVTSYENKRRSSSWQVAGQLQRDRTHCPKQHPYSEENTYINQGRRNCIICKKAAARKSYLKIKGTK